MKKQRFSAVAVLLAGVCGFTACSPQEHVHEYETEIVSPTCTEQGYTRYTCKEGDDAYNDSFVDALGHDFSDGICSRCGATDPDFNPDPKPVPTQAGTLRIVGSHDEEENIFQGRAYLVYTNTSASPVTITVPNLYASYFMTEEYFSAVKEDSAALSWRYDGTGTANEHLAVANNSFTYNTSETKGYNTIVLQPGEFVTFGNYDMADNVAYAALEAFRPVAESYGDEDGVALLFFNILSSYLRAGEMSEENYEEIYDVAAGKIAKQLITTDFYDNVMGVYQTVISLFGIYQQNGTITETEYYNALSPYLQEILGENSYEKVMAVINGSVAIASAYEADTLTFDLVLSEAEKIFYAIAGKENEQLATKAAAIIGQIETELENNTLTGEKLQTYLNQLVALFGGEGDPFAQATVKAVASLYESYVADELSEQALLGVLVDFVADLYGDEAALQLSEILSDALTLVGKYQSGELAYADVKALAEKYIKKYAGEEVLSEVQTILTAAEKLYGSYLDGTLTIDSASEVVLPVIKELAPGEYDVSVSLFKAAKALWQLYSDGELTVESAADVLDTCFGEILSEEQYQTVSKFMTAACDLYSQYASGSMTLDSAAAVLLPLVKDYLPEEEYEILSSVYQAVSDLYDLYLGGELDEESANAVLLPLITKYVGEENVEKAQTISLAISTVVKGLSDGTLDHQTAVAELLVVVKELASADVYNKVKTLIDSGYAIYSAYVAGEPMELVVAAEVLKLGKVFLTDEQYKQLVQIVSDFGIAVSMGKIDPSDPMSIADYYIEKNFPGYSEVVRLMMGGVSEGGIVLNRELYDQKYQYDQFSNQVYEVDLASFDQLENMLAYLSENNYFNLFNHNSATVAAGGWNAAVGVDAQGKNTPLYIKSAGDYLYKSFDLPMAICAGILKLKDSEKATAAGGRYVGENLTIPAVGQVTLPEAEILGEGGMELLPVEGLDELIEYIRNHIAVSGDLQGLEELLGYIFGSIMVPGEGQPGGEVLFDPSVLEKVGYALSVFVPSFEGVRAQYEAGELSDEEYFLQVKEIVKTALKQIFTVTELQPDEEGGAEVLPEYGEIADAA